FCVCLLVSSVSRSHAYAVPVPATDRQIDTPRGASSEFSLLYYIFKYISINKSINTCINTFYFFLLFFKLILCVFACWFSVQKPRRLRSSSACDRQTDRHTERTAPSEERRVGRECRSR